MDRPPPLPMPNRPVELAVSGTSRHPRRAASSAARNDQRAAERNGRLPRAQLRAVRAQESAGSRGGDVADPHRCGYDAAGRQPRGRADPVPPLGTTQSGTSAQRQGGSHAWSPSARRSTCRRSSSPPPPVSARRCIVSAASRRCEAAFDCSAGAGVAGQLTKETYPGAGTRSATRAPFARASCRTAAWSSGLVFAVRDGA